MKRFKDGMVGFVIGSILCSSIVYATSTLEVNFLPLKYYFDGIEKKPPQDQQGFIYNDRTYVPLRFIAESMGKEVIWEDETKSIYIDESSEVVQNEKDNQVYRSRQIQEYGEWVYYIEDSLEGHNLFKIKKDGTLKTRLNNYPTTSFAIKDNWIYLSERSLATSVNPSGKTELYKMKIDGSSKTKISDSENDLRDFYIVDDMIYYITQLSSSPKADVYSIDVDGSNKQHLINDLFYCIEIIDGYMYYIKPNSSIYKMELAGDGDQVNLVQGGVSLLKGPSGEKPQIKGEWLYYIESSTKNMYKIKTDGSEKHLLSDKKVYNKIVEGKWIYYMDTQFTDDIVNGNLYKIRIDQTNDTLVSEGVGDILVKGDWIYYTDNCYDGNLYRMKADGSEKTLLHKNVQWIEGVGEEYVFVYEAGFEGGRELIRTDIPYEEEVNMEELAKEEEIHRNQLTLKDEMQSQKKQGKELVQGKQLVENGKYIYYAGKNQDVGLYKINSKSKDKMKLDDGIVTNLCIVDDWIYYTVNMSEDYPPKTELYKMKTDGTAKSKIIDGYWILSYYVIGDDIFYVDQETNITKDYEGRRYITNKIFKTDVNGTDRYLINDENLTDVHIDDEWIYYRKAENGHIRKMKLDGTNDMELTKKVSLNMTLKDEWIYYINYADESKIYRMRKDGTDKEKISPYFSEKFIVEEDWIYYINYVGGNLFKVKTDGTNYVNIHMDERLSDLIGVSGDWIYYINMSGHMKRIKIDGTTVQEI